MSIIIKGMDIPESCVACPLHMDLCDRGYHYFIDHPELYERRADGCPISELASHGRLIDAEALAGLHRTLAYLTNYDFHMTAKAWIDAAPTVIPAELPKEESK